VQDIGAGDIRGEKVRRELNPAERERQRLRKRRYEQGLREPWHAHEERMSARKKRHQHELYDGVLPHDAHGNGGAEPLTRVAGLREEIWVARSIGRSLKGEHEGTRSVLHAASPLSKTWRLRARKHLARAALDD
jgi:hypothetical protein